MGWSDEVCSQLAFEQLHGGMVSPRTVIAREVIPENCYATLQALHMQETRKELSRTAVRPENCCGELCMRVNDDDVYVCYCGIRNLKYPDNLIDGHQAMAIDLIKPASTFEKEEMHMYEDAFADIVCVCVCVCVCACTEET